jgi:hypothetical protein
LVTVVLPMPICCSTTPPKINRPRPTTGQSEARPRARVAAERLRHSRQASGATTKAPRAKRRPVN